MPCLFITITLSCHRKTQSMSIVHCHFPPFLTDTIRYCSRCWVCLVSCVLCLASCVLRLVSCAMSPATYGCIQMSTNTHSVFNNLLIVLMPSLQYSSDSASQRPSEKMVKLSTVLFCSLSDHLDSQCLSRISRRTQSPSMAAVVCRAQPLTMLRPT